MSRAAIVSAAISFAAMMSTLAVASCATLPR